MGINNTHVTSCKYDEDMTRGVKITIGNNRHRKLRLKVLVDTHDMDGTLVLAECKALSDPDNPFYTTSIDPVPLLRTYWNFLGVQDQACFANEISCDIVNKEQDLFWVIEVDYGPPVETGEKLAYSVPLSDNPLKWPIIPWMEYIENEKIVERAVCLTDLTFLMRGPAFNKEPGPIVNAAAQQTIDPRTIPDHRGILKFKINYPNIMYSHALNFQFGGTFHAPNQMYFDPLGTGRTDTAGPNSTSVSLGDNGIVPYNFYQYQTAFGDTSSGYDTRIGQGLLPLLLGYPHGTWRFVVAEPDRLDWRILDDGTIVQFCATTISLELRLGDVIGDTGSPSYNPVYQGWSDQVLNNGHTCFVKWMDGSDGEKWVPDPRFTPADGTVPMVDDGTGSQIPKYRLPVPTSVVEVNGSFDLGFADGVDHPDDIREPPQRSDLVRVPTSEPMNLHVDGSQINDPHEPANHIGYGVLRTANYFNITDFYGASALPTSVTIPTFPLPVPSP